MLRLPITVLALGLVVALSAACGDDASDVATLLPIDRQTVAVNDTLSLELAVSNPSGSALTFDFDAPDLPGLEGVTQISGTPAGGLFEWTPLASHVGDHELTFIVRSEAGEDRESAIIRVVASTSAAPVFLSPGAGGTYDLGEDPCVNFDIEVRDDDSLNVDISMTDAAPPGATVSALGGKQAEFEWCPASDQIDSAERWTVVFEADDGEHVPTLHSYVIVLRTPPKENCPGDPPRITIVSPSAGDEVVSGIGFPVVADVTDDTGLRDRPLLYFTTSAPDDIQNPDLTDFELVTFESTGGDRFSARVPLDLAVDQRQVVYAVVSATDNDDATGTACDQTTDSDVLRFVAVGGSGGETLAVCQPCIASSDCASGICATGAGGSVCLDECRPDICNDVQCNPATTIEGATWDVCHSYESICDGGGGGDCTDDSREPNDSVIESTNWDGSPVTGEICASNVDVFSIAVSDGEQVVVTLDGFNSSNGDLDMWLVDRDATVLARSEGVTNVETITYVPSASGTFYVVVLGFQRDENGYSLRADVSEAPCIDDANEPNDEAGTATRIESGDSFDGVICPDNSDYYSIEIAEPTTIEVLVVFDHADVDGDVELLGPTGARAAISNSTNDDESISYDATATGRYLVRVYGFGRTSGEYLADLTLSTGGGTAGCREDDECDATEVCDAGECVDGFCFDETECPDGYLCPWEDTDLYEVICAAPCDGDSDCRAATACKWLVSGRGCAETGGGLNGASCESYSDCGGQRTCVAWEGGYCARIGCTRGSDCEAGTHCFMDGDIGVCALDCFDSDDICRLDEGYTCAFVRDTEDDGEFACISP